VSINSNDKNSVNIIIQAQDRATEVLKGTKAELNAIANSAALAQAKFVAMGAAIAGVGSLAVTKLSQLNGAIQVISRTSKQPFVSNQLQGIQNDAIASTQQIQKLTDVLGTLGKASIPIGSGLTKGIFDQISKIPEIPQQKIVDPIRNSFTKAFGTLRQELAKSAENGGLGKVLNRALQNEVISNTLKSNLSSAITEKLKSAAFGSALNPGGKGFDVIKKGFDLTKNYAPSLAKILGEGNIFDNLEKVLIDRFTQSFTKFQSNVGGKFESAGKALGLGFTGTGIKRSAPDKTVDDELRVLYSNIIRPSANTLKDKNRELFKGIGKSLFTSPENNPSAPDLGFIDRKIIDLLKSTGGKLVEGQAVGRANGLVNKGSNSLVDALVKLTPQSLKVPLKVLLNETELNKSAQKISVQIGNSLKNIAKEPTEVLTNQFINKANEALNTGFAEIGKSIPISFRKSVVGGISGTSQAVRGVVAGFVKDNILSTVVTTITGNPLLGGLAPIIRDAIFNPKALTDMLPLLKGSISFVINGIKKIIGAAQFTADIINKFNQVDSLLNGLLSRTLVSFGTRFINGFTQEVGSGISRGLTGVITTGFNKLRTTIEGIPLIGKTLVNQLLNLNAWDEAVLTIVDKVSTVPKKISGVLSGASKPFAFVAGFNEPLELFDEFQKGFSSVANGINAVSQNIFFFTSAFQSVQGLVSNGPFKLLIGQNQELRAQLIQTQSTLVATNKIMRDGLEIKDPTQAITALNAPIQAAIDKIRQGSLALTGVTSNQLIDVFNTVSTYASQVGLDLNKSADLTLSMASALSSLNLPLSQQRQEVASILSYNIDNNSVVAKSLGLTNDLVKNLVQQGKLYDFLTQKLSAFRAGNALNSRSIEGITSNIQEIFEVISMKAGEPLLDPLIDQLNRFYQYLNSNQSFLRTYLEGIVSSLLTIGLQFARIIESVAAGVGDVLLAIPQYLFKELAAGATAFADAIDFTMKALRPFFSTIVQLAQFVVANLSKWPAQLAIGLIVASKGVELLSKSFGILSQLLPGVGELLFAVFVRSGPLVNQFTFLAKNTNVATSAFLVLGQNLDKMPFLMNVVASKIPIVGSAFAGVIPHLSKFAIALIGLNSSFPVVGEVVNTFSKTISKDLLPGLIELAENKGMPELTGALSRLGAGLDSATEKGGILAIAQAQLKNVSFEVGKAIAKQALTLGIWGIAIATAVIAINELIQRSTDSGDKIRQLGKDMDLSAQSIRSTWRETKKVISEGLTPPSQDLDWVDTIIGKYREIGTAGIEIRNFWDGLQVAGAAVLGAIDAVATGARNLGIILAATIDGVIDGVSIAVKSVQTLGKAMSNPLKAFKEGVDTSEVVAIRKKMEATWQEAFKGMNSDTIFGSMKKKSEEAGEEIAAAINSGSLRKSVKNQVDAINELVSGSRGKAGSLFKESLKPVNEAIDGLKNNSKKVADIKAAIATLPDAIPQNRKEDLLNFFDQEFPDGTIASSQSVKNLSKDIEKFNTDTKGKFSESLDPVRESINQFQAGKISIDQLQSSLNKLPASLPKDAIASFSTSLSTTFSGLSNSIETINADASNIKLQTARDSINEFTQSLNDQLTALKKAGKGYSPAANELRSLIGKLEGSKTSLNDFSNAVQISADPVQILTNKLKNINTELELLNSQTALVEKQSIAKLTEAFSKATATSGGKALEIQRKFEQDKTQASSDSLKKQLADNDVRLKEAEGLYGKLSDEEKGRATESLKEITKLRTQSETLRTQITENEIQKQSTLYQNSYADIEDAQKKATDATKSAENNRLIATQKAINIGVLTETEANEQKANSAKAVADQELAIEQSNQQKLSALLANAPVGKRKELEDQLRGARLKTQDAVEKSLQAESAAYKSHIDTLKAANERNQNLQLTNLQKLYNLGKVQQEEIEVAKADATVKGLSEQLKLETRDKDKRAQLSLQLQEAIFSQVTARINRTKALTERVQLEEQLALEKGINLGAKTKDEADVVRAQQTVKRLEQEAQLETRDINKRLQLQIDLEKAVGSLYEATIAQKLAVLERSQLREQIILQKGINEGVVLHEDAEVKKAEQSVERIRQQFEFEKRDKTKKLQLELQLNQAIEALYNARLARAKAKIEDQNLAQKNQIDEQNQLIQRQSELYDLIGKAIENRNKLLQAGKELSAAAASFASSEVDLLAQGERSELKKQELARINAAIKLNALKTQQQYERESLNMQIEQNKLAIEREKIQNRIAQGQQEAAIAEAKGNLEVANLDRRTTPAQRKALELKLQAAINQLGFLKQDGTLIDEKAKTDDRVAELNKRKQQFEQLSQTRSAQRALIDTLAPGQKARANRTFREMIAGDLGTSSYRDLLNQGRALEQGAVQSNFGAGRRSDLLSNFDPGLEDLADVLPSDRINRAVQDASKRFGKEFGPNIPGETTFRESGSPALKLPSEATTPLKLPDLKDVGINLAKSGNIFSQGIDKLVGMFKSGKAGGSTTYQINVNNQGSANQQANGAIANNQQVSLERVVKAVKWMAAGT
jgi:hypothetical protein